MRRIIYGLLMLGGLAFVAAPAHAAFDLQLECGHSYAVSMNGTEPTSSSDAAPHFIAAVGTLKLGPSSGIGGTCQITGGELLYNDEDQLTMFGGPAGCYAANGGLLGNPGVPCFNGSTTISGALANNVGLSGGVDGGATLNMVVAFPFSLPGGGAAPDLPLSFHIQSNYGAWVVGNSVSDGGPTPANPPPGSPVLTLTMQEQSSTVSLPVTGPAAPGQGFGNGNPFAPFMLAAPLCGAGQGCTTNGIGVAPYLGLTVSSASGFGSLSGDPTAGLLAALEGTPTATFGTTTGATQFFANGLAGGSVSFDDNDDVGNTTGATNNDCDVGITATGNFADGSSNLGAWGQHPSLSCSDAAAGFSFYLGSVAWGPTDTNGFYIVEGIAAVSGAPLAPTGSTGILPPGDQSTAVDLASVPAGALYPLVSSTLISVKSSAPYTGYVSFFSTTPAGCDVTASMANSSAGVCSLTMVQGTPYSFVVEGDTYVPPSVFVQYANPKCTCTGVTPASSTSSTLTLTFADCPVPTLPAGATAVAGGFSLPITCKN